EVDVNNAAYASHHDEQAVHVRRGDVVVGDSRLLHGAYANTSEHERPLITLWYIPNWGTLPDNVQATLCDIYQRKVVDIDDGEEDLPTCDAWPASAFEHIRNLVPRYEGKSQSLRWNRVPEVHKMEKP
ncbi:MAG: phytanoyl-CoA dioxygenase family protein, partial [Pseudomonadota bacterium]